MTTLELGPLSDGHVARIADATAEELDRWMGRLLVAASPDD